MIVTEGLVSDSNRLFGGTSTDTPVKHRPGQKGTSTASMRECLPQGDLLIRQTHFFTRYHGGQHRGHQFLFPLLFRMDFSEANR